MRITALNIHPVKSTAIRPLQSIPIDPAGPRDDRAWMVVDASGELVSAREVAALFRIVADTATTEPGLTKALRMRSAGHEELSLDAPAGERVAVRVHGTELEGIPAGDAADAWVRAVTGRDDLRLIWCDDPARRELPHENTQPQDHTRFADSYPVTVGSERSLQQLNEWIAVVAQERGEHPSFIPMKRFRPNIVVDGDEPFAEDDWRHLQIGEVRLRVIEPVPRCVMTMIDPTSLDRGKEPIRTLARYRRPATETLFCVHLVPEQTGTISVGDEVVAE